MPSASYRISAGRVRVVVHKSTHRETEVASEGGRPNSSSTYWPFVKEGRNLGVAIGNWIKANVTVICTDENNWGQFLHAG